MIICDHHRRVAAIGCAVMMMTWASTALAQDPNPQAPFDQARVLMKSGRYAEALPKLEESLFIKVTGGALLNYADCLEKLGRYASAVDAFDRARTIFEETKDARRADEAKTRAATLRPVLSTITVKSTTTKDISVVIGRKTVTPNTPVPVDGGEHAITVVASCHKPFETKVTVALRGDTKEVVADLAPTHECGGATAPPPPPTPTPPPVKTAPPPPPPPPPPVVSTSSPSTSSSMPPLAIASGVVGVVGIGLGTFFGLRASSTKDDLDAACTSYPTGCPSSRRTEIEELASDANTQAVVSTIGFIAGAAFLAGAVVLYVTAPKRSSRTGFVAPAGVLFF